MINSLFIINSSGDVILEKHWKSVIHRSICDYFFEAQKRASSPEDVSPIISTPHHYLISIFRNQLYFISVITSEVSPLLVIEFLHRVVDTFKEYFDECSDASIKENYVIVFENRTQSKMNLILLMLMCGSATLLNVNGEDVKVGEICVKKTIGVYLRAGYSINRDARIQTADACIKKCATFKRKIRRTGKSVTCRWALLTVNRRTNRKFCQLFASSKRATVRKGSPANILQEILEKCPQVPAAKAMVNDMEMNDKERWNEWSDWTPCSKTCGRGMKTRTRSCVSGCKVQEAGERDTCQVRTCPTRASRISNTGDISVTNTGESPLVQRQLPSNQWEEWGSWSPCPQYCSGEIQRSRQCQGYGCQLDNVLRDQCACSQWQAWGSWGSCSASCGGGIKQRQRQCSVPGVCQGEDVQNQVCNLDRPCAVWLPWTPYGACSVSCGSGQQRRSRVCSEVGQCSGERNELRDCNSGPCPSWFERGAWSACSASCDGGRKFRDRGCSHNTLCLGDSSEYLQCGTEPCCRPQWNDWQSWTACPATCGNSAPMERKRTCSHGGYQCDGGQPASYQQETCPTQPCPTWTKWSGWSKCNKECGDGQKQRVRKCQYGDDCQGDSTQMGKCGNQPCAAWQEWSSWSSCSATCGGGQVQRDRSCTGYGECKGETSSYNQCNTQSCATWSDWSPWSECPKTCGEGVVTRQRTCVGGNSCFGDSADRKPCDAGPCPQWADWAPWTQCSATCGSGTITRQRDCQFGTQCDGGSGYGEEQCDAGPCPQWTPWESWTECTVTCGGGFKDRIRDCEDGLAGEDCPGEDYEEANCNENPCAEWSPWGQWSQCSRTCGPGGKTRTRQCENGNNCPGKALEQKNCNERTCAAWTAWNDWTQCSVTCGSGQQQRARTCGGGSGAQCDGTARDSQQCEMPSCPPACVWENWYQWGPCSASCGPGTQKRSRKCSCYAGCPQNMGGPMETKACQASVCARDESGNSYLPDPNNPAHAQFYKSRNG